MTERLHTHKPRFGVRQRKADETTSQFATELERELYEALRHLVEMVEAQERERTPERRREGADDYSSRTERDEVFGAALKDARAALAKADPTTACLDCNGTGLRDSGGVYPWGETVMVPCDCATDPTTEKNDG